MGLTERRVQLSRGDGWENVTEVVDASQDSIEFSVNAKGEPSFTVKAYARDSTEIATRIHALLTIAEGLAADARTRKGGA